MVKVSFIGKVRLEQRPEGSEEAGPAAFPVEGTTKVIAQESAGLFKKRISMRPVVAGGK